MGGWGRNSHQEDPPPPQLKGCLRSKGNFAHLGHTNPGMGFKEPRVGFRRFLEGPFGGFCVQGAQQRSDCRATEGTLNTQTPERASKNPVWSPEGS